MKNQSVSSPNSNVDDPEFAMETLQQDNCGNCIDGLINARHTCFNCDQIQDFA